jgi:hypothetical protein
MNVRRTAKISDALHPGIDYEPRIADEVTAESSGRCRQIHGCFRLKFRGIYADMRIETPRPERHRRPSPEKASF